MSLDVDGIVDLDTEVSKEAGERPVTEVQDVATSHFEKLLKEVLLPKDQRCHSVATLSLDTSNDPSSAMVATGSAVDCNRDAMPPFAVAYG
jgi:hypothetical protein